MTYASLPQRFLEAMDRFACPRAQIFKGADRWESVSAGEMLRRVAGFSDALGALGIKPGDRVGLFSPNRAEWHVVDFAVNGLGAVTVPIYFNESAEHIVYILRDSAARIVVAAGEEQISRLAACRDQLRDVEHMVAAGWSGDLPGDFLRFETLIAAAGDPAVAEYRRRAALVGPEQLATIIYTSGTTGEPKGVMLTHSNLSSNATDAFRSYGFGPQDLALSVLPLAHVYGRIMDYGYIFRGIPIAYVERMDQIQQALLEVRPTVLAVVPRFFEKTYANIMQTGKHLTGYQRKLFDWALRTAEKAIPWKAYGKPAPPGLKVSWWLANRAVYSRFRAGLGGRIRMFSSGGAPLSPALAEFFWSVGIPVYQGYGLTETSPVVTANVPGANKIGTVGRPIPNVDVRIAEDGEILVRGACVMQGYYHKPDLTREVFTEEGWLRTGDIGYLDEDGFLVVTDRKKELLKTAAGKFVAPQPIENRLKSSPYILNAVVVGDRRKFVSALVVPNFPAVEARGREEGRTFGSPAELAAHPWARQLIGGEIERLTSNLAQYERPKRFALLAEDFSFANGELTYTLKLKRRIIEQRYRDIIEQLYADVEEPRPQAHA